MNHYQMTSYREYFRMKVHDERWVKRMIERYNLSPHYPRCAEYVLRREAYLEGSDGGYL